MQSSRILTMGTALLLAATLCAAELPTYTAEPAASAVSFTGSQEGLKFTGNFGEFNARITFDPDGLAASSISATVSTASADSKNKDRDTLLVGSDWLASALWPSATFVSTAIKAGDKPDQFIANGKLTLRDISQEVRLTFSITDSTLQPEAKQFTGSMNVQRLNFGVGKGDWADTRWVANEVVINIELLLLPE